MSISYRVSAQSSIAGREEGPGSGAEGHPRSSLARGIPLPRLPHTALSVSPSLSVTMDMGDDDALLLEAAALAEQHFQRRDAPVAASGAANHGSGPVRSPLYASCALKE